MKESFIIYKGFFEPIKTLTNEQLGELFRYIFLYQLEGIEPSNTESIYMAFQFFKNQFRLDEDKYQKVVERNKNNGSKGGRPKQEPKETKKTQSVILKPKKAYNDNDKDINKLIPTLNEFLDYAKTQKSYNSNLEHAIQIKYESWVANGWVDGYGNKIERWKGKLISTLPHLKPIEKQVKLNWKGEPCE